MAVKGHMTKPTWRPLQSATLLTVLFYAVLLPQDTMSQI